MDQQNVDTELWLSELCARFQLEGDMQNWETLEIGLMNRTYKVELTSRGNVRGYILQKLNGEVFSEPVRVIENVKLVTEHIGAQTILAGKQKLKLFSTSEGLAYAIDHSGGYWRCYNCIEDAYTVDVVENEDQAYAAAKGYGEFLENVASLDASALYEVIPDFHHTPKRLSTLRVSIKRDESSRVELAKAEIEVILVRESICASLQNLRDSKSLPERVTHNDTKINNVMLSRSSGEAVCVIDLDTVMPGLSLYDFGDLARASVSPAAEDEPDLSRVEVRLPIFQALCRGFLQGCPSLTRVEKENLVRAIRVITLELAIRFLTDYLDGDQYFPVQYPEHNLVRCRNQLALVKALEEKEEEMESYVKQLF